MEKYGFVYIWFDRKHKRYYIGSHWGTEDDGYVCSSNWMYNTWKRRPDDFKRRIIQRVTDRWSLLDEEQKWLQLIKPEELRVRYYNMTRTTKEPWYKYPDKVKTVSEKISHRTKEAMNSPEIRAKMEKVYASQRGKKVPRDIVEKQRKSMIKSWAIRSPIEDRYVPSSGEEYSKKLSEASKQMWVNRTDEERAAIGAKISEANKGLKTRLGQTNSEEHRRKISEAQKGRKFTEEHKAKLRKPRRKRTPEERALQSERIKAAWARRRA